MMDTSCEEYKSFAGSTLKIGDNDVKIKIEETENSSLQNYVAIETVASTTSCKVEEDEVVDTYEDDDTQLKIQDRETYVKVALETVMEDYWPQPKSIYYCRLCNYAEFLDDQALRDHQQKQDHILKECNADEAFCLICQIHATDKLNMIEHCKTEKHFKLLDVYNNTVADANLFWDANPLTSDQDNDTSKPDDFELSDEVFKKHLKQIMKVMMERLKVFYAKHDSNSHPVNDYVNLMVFEVMTPKPAQPKSKYFCRICNNISFQSIEQKNQHFKSKYHHLYIKGLTSFRCKLCQLTCPSRDIFSIHKQTQQHKKMQSVYKYCKQETIKHIRKHRKSVAQDSDGMKLLKKILYPFNNTFISESGCKLCDKDFPAFMLKKIDKTIGDHLVAKKHQNKLQFFYKDKVKNGFTFTTGCALCNIDMGDSGRFDVKVHRETIQHKNKLVEYQQTIGLLNQDEIERAKFEKQKSKIFKSFNQGTNTGGKPTQPLNVGLNQPDAGNPFTTVQRGINVLSSIQQQINTYSNTRKRNHQQHFNGNSLTKPIDTVSDSGVHCPPHGGHSHTQPFSYKRQKVDSDHMSDRYNAHITQSEKYFDRNNQNYDNYAGNDHLNKQVNNCGRPNKDYGRSNDNYVSPNSNYDRQSNNFDRPSNNYARPNNRYVRPSNDYARPNNNYGGQNLDINSTFKSAHENYPSDVNHHKVVANNTNNSNNISPMTEHRSYNNSYQRINNNDQCNLYNNSSFETETSNTNTAAKYDNYSNTQTNKCHISQYSHIDQPNSHSSFKSHSEHSSNVSKNTDIRFDGYRARESFDNVSDYNESYDNSGSYVAKCDRNNMNSHDNSTQSQPRYQQPHSKPGFDYYDNGY